VKLLGRFTPSRHVVVNYDPDAAGQAATERSLALLLEQGFNVRVLVLPGGADPDKFIREQGGESYQKLLGQAPAYLDYLISRARQMDLSTVEGKLRAVNFLMPYLQRIPNRLLRSEWATRIAAQLRIDEPVLRASLRRAAAERRSEVKAKPELIASGAKPVERRLIKMLIESDALRAKIAEEIRKDELHKGLETEQILGALAEACQSGARPDLAALVEPLSERERHLLSEIAFEPSVEATEEEAESCLSVLRQRRIQAELEAVQKQIEANPPAAELRKLLARKQELRRQLT